jgi:polygalacturonase
LLVGWKKPYESSQFDPASWYRANRPGASLAFGSKGQSSKPFELLLLPQDFGAKVDGTTLDSVAINAAIDHAGGQGVVVVYLSPGVYRCGTVVSRAM